MSVLKYVLAASACVSVAGCYDLSEYEEAADYGRQVERARDFFDRRDRIEELSNTAFGAVPTTGTATYQGNMSLLIGSRDDNLDDSLDLIGADVLWVIGDSEVEIDFGETGSSAVSGTVDTLRRATLSPLDPSEAIEGQVDIFAGTIGAGAANDISLEYAGEFTVDNQDFLIDGIADGKLRGTRTQINPGQSAVRAYEVEDTDVTVETGNGNSDYVGRVTFNGEN